MTSIVMTVLLIVLLCSCGLGDKLRNVAESTEGLEFRYIDEIAGYSVVGIGSATDEHIVIGKHNGLPVSSIDVFAFEDCDTIKSLTVESCVKNINNFAFSGCDNLMTVTIADGVISVSSSAFSECPNLIYNEYDGLEYLGNKKNPYYALMDVPKELEGEVKVHKDTRITSRIEWKYKKISYNEHEGACYLGDGKNPYKFLAYVKDTTITETNIHEDAEYICPNAFSRCLELKSISVPRKVEIIGTDAFHCYNVESIHISEGVEIIASRAFNSGYNCTELSIPKSVKEIHSHALDWFALLPTFTISKNVEFIGEGAISGFEKLEEIKVHPRNRYYQSVDGVLYSKDMTHLHTYPMNKSDETFVIPDSVKTIGFRAFYRSMNMKTLECGDGLEEIQLDAFLFSRVETVRLNEGLKRIEDGTFHYSNLLIEINLPSTLEYIGDQAFYCDSLTEIHIPPSVKYVGFNAFGRKVVVYYSKDCDMSEWHPLWPLESKDRIEE